MIIDFITPYKKGGKFGHIEEQLEFHFIQSLRLKQEHIYDFNPFGTFNRYTVQHLRVTSKPRIYMPQVVYPERSRCFGKIVVICNISCDGPGRGGTYDFYLLNLLYL